MAPTCCLAGIDRAAVTLLMSVLRSADIAAPATLARLDVTELGRLKPHVLVCDIDAVDIDGIEFLRRLRFVLPDCLIAVYTGIMHRTWGVACHLAGANCMLSKESDAEALADGVRDAIQTGCYTDPRFAAA